MNRHWTLLLSLTTVLTSLPLAEWQGQAQNAAAATDKPAPTPKREPDVIFVPTPQPAVEKMLELAEAGDPEAYSDANVAFHSAIYAGTHNAPIADYTLGLRRRVGPFRRAQFQVEGRLLRSTQDRKSVV